MADYSSDRAPISKTLSLTGSPQSIIPPRGTRVVQYRFDTTAGEVALGGGDLVPVDPDAWFKEVFREDDEGPVEVGTTVMQVKGTGSNDLHLVFKKRVG